MGPIQYLVCGKPHSVLLLVLTAQGQGGLGVGHAR